MHHGDPPSSPAWEVEVEVELDVELEVDISFEPQVELEDLKIKLRLRLRLNIVLRGARVSRTEYCYRCKNGEMFRFLCVP